MNGNRHYVGTDFGITVITPETMEFFGGEEGYQIITNKRIRNKKAKELRRRHDSLMDAIKTLAWVKYEQGKNLDSI